MGKNLTGGRMKICVGIDMAKDKLDNCAMNDSLNILCKGSNRENSNQRFKELSDLNTEISRYNDEDRNGIHRNISYSVIQPPQKRRIPCTHT
ncbi:MAG: hypothetical protein QW478_09340 [Candidatus Micrarchaeaceae archaeon]